MFTTPAGFRRVGWTMLNGKPRDALDTRHDKKWAFQRENSFLAGESGGDASRIPPAASGLCSTAQRLPTHIHFCKKCTELTLQRDKRRSWQVCLRKKQRLFDRREKQKHRESRAHSFLIIPVLQLSFSSPARKRTGAIHGFSPKVRRGEELRTGQKDDRAD